MAEIPERRASRRVPLVTRVETQAGGFSFLAVSENVSEGGMLVYTANPVPEGQSVHLAFVLPGTDRIIRASATVRRVVPGTSMGVHFDALEPADREAIRQFSQSS